MVKYVGHASGGPSGGPSAPSSFACSSPSHLFQVFLWRVPEGFTLHSDIPADDIKDIAPIGKLSGHPR